jgi:flavodoxin
MNDKKILIAYFSHSGNTETAANMIKNILDADLFEINSIKKYSENYHTCTEEAKADQQVDARPELVEYLDNIDDYDVILLGYPNWWSTMPMPVFTFLERYDFSGKTILPFCTHGGGGMGRSESDIQKECQGAVLLKGISLGGSSARNSEKEIREWLAGSGLI